MIARILSLPQERWGKWLALAMGLFAFFIVVGPKPLIPTNLDWINGIDPAQHYLGWALYRFGPWTLPIGLNPHYGLEISSSIVFSDSIPLLAILLKPFSAWLPEPFQYLGIWVLLCLVLQAYFVFLLMGIITDRLLLKVLAMGLLVFAPPMLWRIGLHAALVAHFVILAAFYLAFSQSHRKRMGLWIALIVVTALIHVYLLLMVLCIWFGSFLDQLVIAKTKTYKRAALELVICLLIVGFCLWQAGYFALGMQSAATSDFYGAWGLNLLSFLDSQNWSYLPSLTPQINANNESSFYLGMGILLLLVLCLLKVRLIGVWIRSTFARHRMLAACLLVLLLFAISHEVRFGAWHFSYSLPQVWIEQYASIFRLSARLAWPIWYALVLGIVIGVIRYFTYAQAIIILLLALVLQITDLSHGYLPLRERNQAIQDLRFGQPTKSDFWQAAAQRYARVRFFPLHTNPLPQPHWYTLSSYSAKYHLATNAVYLSRLDGAKVQQANTQFWQQLQKGGLDTNTLYIFESNDVANIRPWINRQTDYFALMDEHLAVLAPRWKSCANCAFDVAEQALDDAILKPKIGERLPFVASAQAVRNLGWGWAQPESWGVWAQEPFAVLTLAAPAQAKSLTLEWNALVSKDRPIQRIFVRIAKAGAYEFALTQARNNVMTIAVPSYLRGSDLQLEFTFLDPIRPKTLGMGDDARLLSAGLLSARFD